MSIQYRTQSEEVPSLAKRTVGQNQHLCNANMDFPLAEKIGKMQEGKILDGKYTARSLIQILMDFFEIKAAN